MSRKLEKNVLHVRHHERITKQYFFLDLLGQLPSRYPLLDLPLAQAVLPDGQAEGAKKGGGECVLAIPTVFLYDDKARRTSNSNSSNNSNKFLCTVVGEKTRTDIEFALS